MSNQISDCYIRKVKPEDVDILFQWANDPTTRNNAFNTAQIPYENHLKWFEKTLNDPDRIQLVFISGDVPVGQFRVDIEERIGEVDYSVAPAFRGKGYGSEMCKKAVEYIKSTGLVDRLIAKVKTENTVSKKCFMKSGFSSAFEQFEMSLEG